MAGAPKGTRNDTLNKAAYSLSRFVETGEADAADVARNLAWAATQAGLSEDEILRTVLSAFQARGVTA